MQPGLDLLNSSETSYYVVYCSCCTAGGAASARIYACFRPAALVLYVPFLMGKNPEVTKCSRLDINLLHAVSMGEGLMCGPQKNNYLAAKMENVCFVCQKGAYKRASDAAG